MRNYGPPDQFGLEENFHDYLDKLMILMGEIRRVLKDSGSVWINIGDKYDTHKQIQPKTRLGIPERFYARCIDDGWLARNYCIWYKRSHKPEPVTDRFTINWEPVLFFTKKQHYYFDLDPLRIPAKTKDNWGRKTEGVQTSLDGKTIDEKVDSGNAKTAGMKPTNKKCNNPFLPDGHSQSVDKYQYKYSHPKGTNPGAVFDINIRPFPAAHFATFPPELPERILKCACPQDGIVLDPFFGAGTTGLAAEKLGRKWIGIELDPESVQIAQDRLAKYHNKQLQ